MLVGFKVKDHYFLKAKKENFLARSIYKLEEIDKKYKIIKKGDTILDLGYYPGSWIQYSSPKVGRSGHVVGIDLQQVDGKLQQYKNVTLIEKNIFDLSSLTELNREKKFDIILSDMAPKTTGIKSVDQQSSLNLVKSAFELFPPFLKEGGRCVLKVFESNHAREFLKTQKKKFKTFNFFRPKSTRVQSVEFFFIAQGYGV